MFLIEHALEFEVFDLFFEFVDICLYRFQRGIIVLFFGHFKQLQSIGEAGSQVFDGKNNVFETFLLFAQLLSALLIGPDARIFERLIDFF